MSYRLMDLCMDIPSLTSAEWSVLVALCRYASNDDHTCFPSLEVVATVAHLTLRTVQRTLPSLVERNLVTILEKANGRGNRNKFQINATLLRELKTKDDTTTSFIEDDSGDASNVNGDTVTPISETKRVTMTPTKGDTMSYPKGDTETVKGDTVSQKGDIDASLYKKNLLGIGYESVSSESVSESVRAHALSTSRSLSLAVNPEASADLSEIATRIAVAHPRNMLKHITALEVPTRDLQAIVEAILLEAGKGDVTEVEAGEMLLRMVEELQAAVPRGEWHFLKPVTAYFGEFEYRRDPETFKRSTGARGGASNGKRRGTDGNDEALREFMAGQAGGGYGHPGFTEPVGGRVREDAEPDDIPALHGSAGRPDAGTDRPGVLAGVGGVQGILPKPSYPPRVQWPRRNG